MAILHASKWLYGHYEDKNWHWRKPLHDNPMAYDTLPTTEALDTEPCDVETVEWARLLMRACWHMRDQCLGGLYASMMDDKAEKFRQRGEDLALVEHKKKWGGAHSCLIAKEPRDGTH